jgi:hypothetical protein
MGSSIGSSIGESVGEHAGSFIEKKVKGTGYKSSKAYKGALKLNYGVTLPVQESTKRGGGMKGMNSKIRPASSEMTLSPYASTTSPQMHPFVPHSYFEMGGNGSSQGR